MRRILPLGLVLLLLSSLATDAQAQVRINEVGYAGVDFMGASKWVELYNAGDSDVDVSGLWLCNFPSYSQISTLTILDGTMVIPAGGNLVVAFDALGVDDGEVGLYTANQFSSAAAMADYMQYGSAGHTRESVAVTAEVWTAGAFASAPASGMTLAFVGTGATSAASWIAATASPGAGNGADHAAAARTSIDRFSAEAGNLFVRAGGNTLPEANAAIDFDLAPFITQGFGPAGDIIQYYNFDVQPTAPAPIYVLFREGEDAPVAGQFNIVDAIPGEDNYNDFWQPMKVTVPANYVANAISSAEAIVAGGYAMEPLDAIVNCPIVPEGSTAALRLNTANGAGLVNGWYKGEAVFYFEFGEAALTPQEDGSVPLSPIYVAFNINPDQPNGGPPSGFLTEEGTAQTHNVLATLPGDVEYSPLWVVNIFDNADFGSVSDLASAQAATILAAGAANVNCPVVAVQGDVAVEELTGEAPTQFALHGNFPNPFNPTTTIHYELVDAGQVVLSVFNVLGQRVAELVNGVHAAGVYQVQWDGRDSDGQVAASGVYLYRVTLDGRQSQSRIMTLLK